MKRFFCAALAVLFLFAVCTACGAGKTSPGYPVTVGDVSFSSSPRRVVCMSRALTEGVSVLGFGGRIVGVDDSSDRPAAAVRGLPQCGSVLLPDTETILSLSPDLVLTQVPLPSAAAEALAKQEIPVLMIPYSDTFDGILSNLSALAAVFAGADGGAGLSEQIEFYADGTLEYLAGGVTEGETAVFLMRLPAAAATGDTWLGEVLTRLGLENGAAAGSGWVFAPEDGVYEADVLFCDESISAEALSQSVWKDTAAVQNGRVVYLDGSLLEAQSPAIFSVLENAVLKAYPDGEFGERPSVSMEIEVPEPNEPGLWEKIRGFFGG